jgi:pimeloyl-ACP methyl ester carboxylesterase
MNGSHLPKARAWGIADLPLAYDPPVSDPSQLVTVRQARPDGPDLITCTEQAGTPRRLVNFARIPVLIAVAESSYHAPYDHCTARYMQQAGVPVEFIRLEDKGIRGNGHMVMIEKNNLEIAALLDNWARSRIR